MHYVLNNIDTCLISDLDYEMHRQVSSVHYPVPPEGWTLLRYYDCALSSTARGMDTTTILRLCTIQYRQRDGHYYDTTIVHYPVPPEGWTLLRYYDCALCSTARGMDTTTILRLCTIQYRQRDGHFYDTTIVHYPVPPGGWTLLRYYDCALSSTARGMDTSTILRLCTIQYRQRDGHYNDTTIVHYPVPPEGWTQLRYYDCALSSTARGMDT